MIKHIEKLIELMAKYQLFFWGALFGAITALALN